MKRSFKMITVIAALALCLFLTGCYVPPDDVNSSGSGTSNKYPFLTNTPAPSEVIVNTPDSSVPTGTQTQNVFGGNQTTTAVQTSAPPDPTPDDNNWGQFGIPTGVAIQLTNGAASPGPDSTISIVTETPPASTEPVTPTPPPTPTPTPKSLQVGFKGSQEVREVQKRLKELGYYKGSVDGDFGTQTEKAVKEFQKANGLTPDGKVGEKTKAKLNSKNAVTYKQAHATPTPKPTAKPTAKPTPKPTPTPTPKPTATPNLSKDYYLTNGSTGKHVETLQRRLIELGWLDGKVTGTYDDATEQAVRAFQRKTSKLWEDGIAGPETLRAIYSSNAARSSKPVASAGEVLEFGSEGTKVRNLQQKLKDLGYLSGSVDGKFGIATQAAVIAFQKNNNLTADGKAGSATLSKLYSGSANKASGNAAKITESDKKKSGRDTSNIASTGYETLENGSTGTMVRKLQERLKKLGYYAGSVDGTFGDATEAAVMAFQLQNNLTVDGKAGPATQRVLYGSGAQSPVSYSALRMGDSGTAVRNLQYTLYELGYYDGSIDGEYGQTTSDAVRAFQIQNSISPVDGVAGSVTLSRLYSSDALAATAANVQYDTVYPGQADDIVVQIQDCLVQMGYLDSITGTYDDATTQAVKEFQQANGLTADGICGSKTLVIMFGY